MAELTVRPTVEGDFEEFMGVSSTAFLDEWVEREPYTRRSFATHRFHVAVDRAGDGSEELVGTCGILGRRVTFPGAGPTPVAAVTAVTVKPGHRRRGALTAMMRTQLDGLHETGGEAVAALWASEAPIYGRFGYGRAAHFLSLDVPADTAFRTGVDLGVDRVRQLPRDEAEPLLAPVYDRVSAQSPGWLDRDELFWGMVLADLPERRQGASELRFAVHPDGYALFRTRRGWGDRGPDGRIHVQEVVAATPVAAAALWRHLLDYDLVGAVTADVAVDDPVTQLLHDPRRAVATHRDSLWVRLVDLDRALTQRRYSGDVDVVLEVSDGFCPWNAGRWRLTARADGPATAARGDDDADLRLDVADLGAAFLGGPTLVQLAAAGRVVELTPGALVPASRAFAGTRAPHCPEVF
ncbi:GNAT family N-acetyltransferase [Pseudonocardia lacus]|uniref:GNAT family N-acetyltransferase n=1 Tax=Pseudonocardia lacus TaxID=2835865 RepID=UPI001BDC44EB|nr:GNAT family N-acetyltransferase [Pseudonocardia lacus]